MASKVNILILYRSNPNLNPTFSLLIEQLSDYYDIDVSCIGPLEESIKARIHRFIEYPRYHGIRTRIKQLFRRDSGQSLPQVASKSREDDIVDQHLLRRERGKTRYDCHLLIGKLLDTVHAVWKLKTYNGGWRGILCLDAGALPAARILSLYLNIPYIYIAYEIYPNQYIWWSRAKSKSMALIERCGAIGAHSIVVPTNVTGRYLKLRYKLKCRNYYSVLTAPHYLNEIHVDPSVHKPLRLYFHGGFQPGLGLEDFIRAVAKVDGIEFYLRGWGVLEPVLHKLCKSFNILDRVHFLNLVPRHQLPASSTKYDIGVIPTASEIHRFGVGLKFFDYTSAGLALIVTHSFVRHSLIMKYNLGIEIKRNDLNSLVSALEFCRDNPEVVQQWKRNARRAAEVEFNPTVQGRELRRAVSETFGITL